ncbi:hypothetical protein ON010_g11687 [Phytophthora cinnamomi]|nr:hypothetical protein ON010_g11687 [Phytophthora cinnamomi]
MRFYVFCTAQLSAVFSGRPHRSRCLLRPESRSAAAPPARPCPACSPSCRSRRRTRTGAGLEDAKPSDGLPVPKLELRLGLARVAHRHEGPGKHVRAADAADQPAGPAGRRRGPRDAVHAAASPAAAAPPPAAAATARAATGARPAAANVPHPRLRTVVAQPPNGYPTTPTAVSLSDIMISGDPSMYLAPSGSPTSLVKQHMMPPMPHAGGAVNVKDLTLNELRPHFNKPMAVVAKELGVCITLMKKICRRNGLVRWPHRRIRSLVNRITSLQVLAGNAAGAERKRFQGQIAGLREELSAVIQNPNEKSRKAQTDTKIPIKMDPMMLSDVKDEFPITQITDEMVGPAEIPSDNNKKGDNGNDNRAAEDIANASTTERRANTTKKTKSKKTKTVKTETSTVDGDMTVEQQKVNETPRAKKRKPSFGLHAHQPPPIKIPRHEELPSMSRLRSQSVPERRLRGDRRYGRGRDTGAACVRPSTTTHRNGRRGSISSILNDIPE